MEDCSGCLATGLATPFQAAGNLYRRGSVETALLITAARLMLDSMRVVIAEEIATALGQRRTRVCSAGPCRPYRRHGDGAGRR